MRFSYLFWSAFISIAIAGTFKDVLDDLQNKLDGPGNKGSFDQATDDELTIGTNAAIKGTNSFASAKNTCSDGFTVKFLKRGFGPAAPWNPFNRVCPAPVSDTDEKPATATKPEPKMLSTPNCRPGYRPYCCWRGPEKIPQRRQIAMKDYKLIEYCEPYNEPPLFPQDACLHEKRHWCCKLFYENSGHSCRRPEGSPYS